MIPDLIAGDDWELHFTVLYPDDSPFNLTGAIIEWTCLDKNSHCVIAPSDVTTTILDAPNGKCAVHAQSSVTTRLLTDFYGHALRVISGGVTATPFTGQLNVMADPYAAAPALRVVDFTKAARASKLIAGNPLRQIPFASSVSTHETAT